MRGSFGSRHLSVHLKNSSQNPLINIDSLIALLEKSAKKSIRSACSEKVIAVKINGMLFFSLRTSSLEAGKCKPDSKH